MLNFDLIVIGGGAAGLMCALTAGQRGRRVLLVDHAERVGKKILISGGGRCNFTNLNVEPENFLSHNPHFCKSALSRFKPQDFIALVEKHGIAYHEKTLGQLFCDGKAIQIVNLLLDECRKGGVRIQTQYRIEKIDRIENQGRFRLQTNAGEFETQSLVIATGGLSVPKIGASAFGYEIAKQFGLPLIPCRPGLVAFRLGDKELKNVEGLSGISVEALVSCNTQSFREAMLFTHKGLSGPAILQISNYWQAGDPIEVNLLPDFHLEKTIPQWKKERPRAELKSCLNAHLSKRLVQRWLEVEPGNKPLCQYNPKEIHAIATRFHRWEVVPSGTAGYRSAEVTTGGVDTDALSSKTFETKSVPGLYFIGEVLDVTGWLGGYNFQWAWASGHCAGLAI